MKDKKIKQEFKIKDNILIKYNEIEGKTEVVIPNNVIKIGDCAFINSSLVSIIISNSVKCIEEIAFAGCYYLKNITLSENLIRIGSSAFRHCDSLTNVIIPKNVEYIGEYAFDGCTNLTSVTLSNKLEVIGRFAFAGCDIKNITLPDSIQFIGNNVFGKHIENINLYSYRVFSILPNELKITALISTIKNYYTGKIKYSDEIMNDFRMYIEENKYELFRYVCYVKDNVELINFMLKNMEKNFITHKDADDLIDKIKNLEIKAMLLEYINQNYNTESKDIASIIDNKFDLGEFDEEKNKEKKLKKGE